MEPAFSVENRLIDITMPLLKTYIHIYHISLAIKYYFQNVMVMHVRFYNARKRYIFRNHIGNTKRQVTKFIKNHTKINHKH